MIEGLKLTIFAYKWKKCVRIVEKCPLESLTNKELFLLPSLFCHDLSLQNKKSPVKGDFLSTGIPI